MKNLLTAAVLIVLTATASAQPLNRTQEYRMWAAERMIERLVDRFGKTIEICKQARSESCQQAVLKLYPIFSTIRDTAADGDDVQWAKLIDIVHQFESQNEAAMNAVNRARL